MSKTVDEIIEEIILIEGRSNKNDKADAGGDTMWGITEAVARADGYVGPMYMLPRERAKSIYYRRYVVAPGFDKVLALSPEIAAELVECGVNCGPALPARFLQEGLNDFNDGATLYPEVSEDGKLGPATLAALGKYLAYRKAAGVVVMLRQLNAKQGVFYANLVRKRPSDERFIYGWYLNRVVI